MSVLIKGMNMPKNCKQCFYRASGCRSNKHNNGRPQDCPLIELPPHGRMFDADALMKQIEHDTPLSAVFEKTIRRYLHNAPAIITADDKDINVLGKEEGEI